MPAGRFYGRVDFDPTDAALVLESAGQSDGFVVRLDLSRLPVRD